MTNQPLDSSRVRLRVRPGGSIRVMGTVDFVDMDGNVIDTRTDFSLCRCGLSKDMPFCDSSHKAGGFAAEGYLVKKEDGEKA